MGTIQGNFSSQFNHHCSWSLSLQEYITFYYSLYTYTDGFDILRSHIDVTLDASKLEAENSYQWKQTKHLLKYIKNQEKEISKTEK